jgi:hypothetical protein
MEQATPDDVTRLTEEIGATLRRVLDESPRLAHCLSRIRAEGYSVSVALEAKIGLSRVERGDAAAVPAFDVRDVRVEKAGAAAHRAEKTEPPPPRMTPLDKKFLRSLKITVDEEE